MKVFFFGTPEFAVPVLEALYKKCDVAGVVSQPDRPRGRGQKLSSSPVKALAQAHHTPVFCPESFKKSSSELDSFLASVEKTSPDLFVVVAYGRLLPQAILDLPRLGAVNVHASLLPRWRGAAPIQRALEAGDTESGVCLQKMVFELDAGDVLAEEKCALNNEINALELSHQLSQMAGTLVSRWIPTIESAQHLKGRPQDPSGVSVAAKIKKEEAFWSPGWSARTTHNRVRAFRAWPGVKAETADGVEVKILKTKLASRHEGIEPGLLVHEQGSTYLGCADGPLELLEVQRPGKPVQNPSALAGQRSLRILKPSE